MNCSNCGGKLSFINDIYRCDNCGATFSLQDIYEKVDVCICYQENDENGRRTKDSIISQDIYKKLEAYKINTYYSRISAGEIIGSDLERATFAAICAAKVIVIVGTTKNRFDATYHMYVEQHAGKIIIPVFSEMNPYDIPKNICAIQALDYNKIGADIDLVKGVLNALGRRKDAEQIGVNKDRTKKGKKTIIVAVATIVVFLLIFFLLYEITAPKPSIDDAIDQPESVTSETNHETQETEKVVTQLEQYNSAVAYLENGELAEALGIFWELSGYKDSDKQRQLIFDKYSGYYKTNDISFHLQTYGDFVANMELSFLINGNVVKITESVQLETQEKNFEFIDSENNFGNITIKFTNDGVVVTVTSTQTSSDLFISDQEILFVLAEKSDKPIINLNAETLLSWVKKATTIEDVRRLGYEVSLEFSSPRQDVYEEYGIENTDVKLESIWETTYITSILAPAEMLIPEYIGKPGNEFYIDGVLVIPNATAYGNPLVQYGWDNDDIITKDTPVLIITEVSFNTAVDDGGWGATFDEYYGFD